eukprot:scaffold38602_cov69-Phaeocystis_antarctica.AAC.3
MVLHHRPQSVCGRALLHHHAQAAMAGPALAYPAMRSPSPSPNQWRTLRCEAALPDGRGLPKRKVDERGQAGRGQVGDRVSVLGDGAHRPACPHAHRAAKIVSFEDVDTHRVDHHDEAPVGDAAKRVELGVDPEAIRVRLELERRGLRRGEQPAQHRARGRAAQLLGLRAAVPHGQAHRLAKVPGYGLNDGGGLLPLVVVAPEAAEVEDGRDQGGLQPPPLTIRKHHGTQPEAVCVSTTGPSQVEQVNVQPRTRSHPRGADQTRTSPASVGRHCPAKILSGRAAPSPLPLRPPPGLRARRLPCG